MNKLFLKVLLLVVLTAGFEADAIASGSTPPERRNSPKSQMQAKAEDALEELRVAYNENNLDSFFGSVSDTSNLNWMDLRSRTERTFKDFNQADLRISVNHVLTENDKVFLKTRWQRRAVNRNTGAVQTSSGDAGFTFQIEEDSAKLIQISGDSPF